MKYRLKTWKDQGSVILWIIPLLSITWCLFYTHLNGPFYLTRIDPEYIYLFNGLNSACLHFDRIGHFDHPGTPFQLLTGVFVRLIYTIAGEGSITQDVFSRPEFYLALSLFFLSVLVFAGILFLGKTAFRISGRYSDALILQAGIFLNVYFLSYSCRYLPDVFLEAAGIVFSIVCLQYIYDSAYTSRKFAIFSGIIMGIGLVSKINFLPLIVIPFIIVPKWKDRLYYIISLVITTFLAFLPVINRFSVTWRLIFNKVTHEGLYGKGEEQILRPDVFIQNLLSIFKENIAFSIILLLTLACIIFLIAKQELRQKYHKQFFFLLGYVVSVLFALFMVAKHYRDYYFIPVASINTIIFYCLYRFGTEVFHSKAVKVFFVGLFFLLILLPNLHIINDCRYLARADRSYNPAANYIRDHVTANDYFVVEPTWESGPLIANGVVYGVSYITHKHVYFNELQPLYPNILTWEGPGNPLKYLRILESDPEVIMKSGRDIYLLSTPGRHADLVCRDIERLSAIVGVHLVKDTVYSCAGRPEVILRYSNSSGWKMIEEIDCGFDNINNNSISSDDGKYTATGPAMPDSLRALNGPYSIKLDRKLRNSPVFTIKGVVLGDFIEVIIKRLRNNKSNYTDGSLVLSETPGGIKSGNVQVEDAPFANIHEQWAIIRLKANVETQPAESTLYCNYQYLGNETILLDDLVIRHSRK